MPWWLTTLAFVGLQILWDFIRPKPRLEDAKPEEFDFPTADEQRPVPILWGTVQLASNIVWADDLQQVPITKNVKTGIITSEDKVVGYRYSLGVQDALCEGQVDELRRVWIGDDLVYSAGGAGSASVVGGGTSYNDGDELTVVGGTFTRPAVLRVQSTTFGGVVAAVTVIDGGDYSVNPPAAASTTVNTGLGSGCTVSLTFDSVITHGDTFTIDRPDLFGGEELGSGGVFAELEFFDGRAAQTASTYLSGFQKEPPLTGDTPTYKGTCYVAPASTPTYFGTQPNTRPWKWEVRRIPNGLSLSASEALVAGGANPANVLYELITSEEFGYGDPASTVDTSSFTAAAATLATEGQGFSFGLFTEEETGDTIRRVEEQIEGLVFQAPTTGLWTIKLIRDDYNPATIPEVSNDMGLVSLRDYNRGTWEGTVNDLSVPFDQADDSYKSTAGRARDLAGRRILGRVSSSSRRHPGVKDAALAALIAERDLRSLSVPLATGTFVVDRTHYGLLPATCSRSRTQTPT